MTEEHKPALRSRTFLKGTIFYDDHSVSIDCTIRDISDTGARVEFQTLVVMPDNVELFIPQRQKTYSARVARREQYEAGLIFEDRRSGDSRRAADGELSERVAMLEQEVAAMARLLKQLKAKILPNEIE